MMRLSTLCCLLVLVSSLATAAPRVFHSPNDDGAEPAGIPTLPSDDDFVFLYVVGDGGASTTGVVCTNGNGGELCGWDVVLHAGPNVEFGGFTPEPGVFSSFDASELRANGVDVSVIDALPIRIGTLQVFATDSALGGTVFVDGVQVVKADLEVDPIATEPMAVLPVPEPGALLQAAFALAAGVGLSRSRRARSTARLKD
jgi:hypothetical protein